MRKPREESEIFPAGGPGRCGAQHFPGPFCF